MHSSTAGRDSWFCPLCVWTEDMPLTLMQGNRRNNLHPNEATEKRICVVCSFCLTAEKNVSLKKKSLQEQAVWQLFNILVEENLTNTRK